MQRITAADLYFFKLFIDYLKADRAMEIKSNSRLTQNEDLSIIFSSNPMENFQISLTKKGLRTAKNISMIRHAPASILHRNEKFSANSLNAQKNTRKTVPNKKHIELVHSLRQMSSDQFGKLLMTASSMATTALAHSMHHCCCGGGCTVQRESVNKCTNTIIEHDNVADECKNVSIFTKTAEAEPQQGTTENETIEATGDNNRSDDIIETHHNQSEQTENNAEDDILNIVESTDVSENWQEYMKHI